MSTLDSNHPVSNPTLTTYWLMTLGNFLNLSVPPVSSFYKMGMIIKTFFKGFLGKLKQRTTSACHSVG